MPLAAVSSRGNAAPFKIGVLIVMVLISAALCVGMLKAPTHQNHETSIFELDYLIGPVTESLLEGRGLLVCTENMGTPGENTCYKSARMPLAASVMALGVRCFGDRPDRIALAKNFVFLIPLWAAMWLVLSSLSSKRQTILIAAGLLLAPLFVVNYLIVITGLDIEEGYLFGLIPLALALIYCIRKPGLSWVLGLSLVLDLIYFTKSSMLLVILVLLGIALIRLPRVGLRAIMFFLIALAPLSWGMYQKHASGRFSVGTSLDGINFHKGNNAEFQSIYPITNSYLDSMDPRLNRGHHFSDEWSSNDFHFREGRNFLLTHVRYTFGSAAKKIYVLLLSTQSYAATPVRAGAAKIILIGLLGFRFLLWASLLIAVAAVITGFRDGRSFGFIYLSFVAAYCLPYVIGFGFTRHAIILAYPAAIFCALSLRPVWRVGLGSSDVTT